MKVFISSLISGFESYRAAARAAIVTLRHEPVQAEDFGAKAMTPQIACMQGVRECDVVVLILGARYGDVQGSSGVAPTHEEYLEARGHKPILVFVEEGIERETRQVAFLKEVQAWQGGGFRAGFKNAEELREKLIRALHEFELANAAGSVDAAAVQAVALAMLPKAGRGRASGAGNLLVAVAGGPARQILRPAALEASELREALHQRAMFGPARFFDKAKGVEDGIEGDALFIEQERGARIKLGEDGSMLLRVPLSRQERSGFPSIIEEDVTRSLAAAIGFADWVWERIDPTQRLSHAAVAATIEAGDFIAWRTQAEHDASPNGGSINMSGGEPSPSALDRPRPALKFHASELAEDLMVPMRRQWKR